MLSFEEFIDLIEQPTAEHVSLCFSKDTLDNKLIFPPFAFPQLSCWDDVVNYIIMSGKKHIVFDWHTEAFIPGVLMLSNYLMEKLIENHNFTENDFSLILGIPDVSINHYYYASYRKFHKYLPKPIYNSFWEKQASKDISPIEISHNISHTKKILCFVKEPRLHRLAMISELIDRNLWDNAVISCLFDIDNIGKRDCEENKLILPNIKDRIDDNIDSIKHLLPIEQNITVNITGDLMDSLTVISSTGIELHENTLFSLVGESSFHNNISLINQYDNLKISCYVYPCFFPTEKTWRAIQCKHPFIIASAPRFLEGLRELGYKTFHPYINESYDTIENEEERILSIMDEVERLCNLNPEETEKWLNSIQQITQYNYERLISVAG